MPAGSVDVILTDPPYLAAYKSRDGRTILNGDHPAWLTRSFAQMYRVLKSDAFAVSFYGWPKVDLFFAASKSAGFTSFRIGLKYTTQRAVVEWSTSTPRSPIISSRWR